MSNIIRKEINRSVCFAPVCMCSLLISILAVMIREDAPVQMVSVCMRVCVCACMGVSVHSHTICVSIFPPSYFVEAQYVCMCVGIYLSICVMSCICLCLDMCVNISVCACTCVCVFCACVEKYSFVNG